jgi:hypothetical protein
VFLVQGGKATSSPTSITGTDATVGSTSQDTRTVQIYNNSLYVSVDSKSGPTNRSFIGTLGTPPATSTYNNNAGPTQLTGFGTSATGKYTISNNNGNGVNANGQQINLSPQNYFFANPSTLYVADSGSPKQTSASSSLGDGGLQKWTNSNADGTGTWSLDYTLSAGLNLVQNSTANPSDISGTTGLYGLAGEVTGNQVYLYGTNYTIGDLDQTYLYGITDSLFATSAAQATGETFAQLAAAPADSNFKGVSFAPAPEPSTMALLAVGLVGAFVAGRRCSKKLR